MDATITYKKWFLGVSVHIKHNIHKIKNDVKHLTRWNRQERRLEVHRDIFICICICSTSKTICRLYLYSDRRPEVSVVHTRNHIKLGKCFMFPHPHTVLFFYPSLFVLLTKLCFMNRLKPSATPSSTEGYWENQIYKYIKISFSWRE